jgi:hypothetical protein
MLAAAFYLQAPRRYITWRLTTVCSVTDCFVLAPESYRPQLRAPNVRFLTLSIAILSSSFRVDSYSEGVDFESQPGHQLPWLRVSKQKMPGEVLC